MARHNKYNPPIEGEPIEGTDHPDAADYKAQDQTRIPVSSQLTREDVENQQRFAKSMKENYPNASYKHGTESAAPGAAKVHKGERIDGKLVPQTGIVKLHGGERIIPSDKPKADHATSTIADWFGDAGKGWL